MLIKLFLLYKPAGYLSQFIYQKKRHKRLLSELYPFPEGTMAIGRLDEMSEGLLVLTTDGMISEYVRGSHFVKTYYAQVDGVITDEAISQLQTGVLIGLKGEKYLTKPCEVERISPNLPSPTLKIRDDRHGPTSWIGLHLTEGKFRQVRKMTAAVGFPTLRLVRVSVGPFVLDAMQPGEVKEVNIPLEFLKNPSSSF
jgi:23S rRNA pseudouridine2457 synthase